MNHQMRNEMKTTLFTLLALTLLFAAPGVHAAEQLLPPDFTAHYTLSRAGLTVATSTVKLARNGDEAVYESETHPAGLVALARSDEIIERSQMEIRDGGLTLLEYLYRHTGGKKLRETRVTVTDGIARGRWNGREAEIAAPPGTMDRFSVQILLMRDLSRGMEHFEYDAIERGKIKTFRFAVAHRETLDLPSGRFEVLRVERLQEQDSDKSLTLWHAPSLHFLPVRIEQVEDGARTTRTLSGIEWGDAPSSPSLPPP